MNFTIQIGSKWGQEGGKFCGYHICKPPYVECLYLVYQILQGGPTTSANLASSPLAQCSGRPSIIQTSPFLLQASIYRGIPLHFPPPTDRRRRRRRNKCGHQIDALHVFRRRWSLPFFPFFNLQNNARYDSDLKHRQL